MKIDRLLGIIMTLSENRKATARSLSEKYGVSIRTIQRDIDTLTLAGIPIYADVGMKGGYQLLEDFKIDRSFLNKNEANLLVSFIKSVQDATPYEDFKNISQKFSTLAEDLKEDSKFSINLSPGLDTDLFRKHLNILTEGRDQLKKVAIKYLNVNYEKTTRIICPHTMVLLSTQWYVYAYCDLRDDFRMFKLHRIVDCELMDEPFELKEMPEIKPWEDYTDPRTETEEIILNIDLCLQGALPDYFGPDVCEIKEDRIVVTVNYSIDEWVHGLILSLTPHVKVVKPTHLRESIKEKLLKAYNKNNYDT